MEVQSSGYDGNLVSHDLLTTGAHNLRAQEQLAAARMHADTLTVTCGDGGNSSSSSSIPAIVCVSEQPGCKTGPSLWKLLPAVAINVF